MNLLGRTVVVKDMDTAIKVAKENSHSFKIVTLLGDIINPSGQMTGGSTASRSNSLLGRSRQIEDLKIEIDNIKQCIIKKENELNNYKGSIACVLEEAKVLENQMQEIQITYATQKQKLDNIQLNISKLESKLEFLKKESSELQIHKERLEDIIKQSEDYTKALDEKISSMQKEVDDFVIKNKDRQNYIDNLNLDITNLKISVSSFDESRVSIDDMIQRIDQDINNTQNSIQKRQRQINDIIIENEQLKTDIENINKEKETVNKNILTNNENILNLKEEREIKNKSIENCEENIINQFKSIEIIKEEISKIDIRKSKLESEIETFINKMWDEYEITPNNAEGYKRPENTYETTKQVSNLRNSIKGLGSVNVDSIEEYKSSKERYDFMSLQKADLEKAQSKLKKIIDDMLKIMKEQFVTQFGVINDNFKRIFKDLFGGGNAGLRLADEENVLETGIEIEVQPPGKKLQNMMLLSGGEKAFTAIALLFAILEINPSPFCILDEIEAALDDVNVYRYAQHLKSYIDKTQFLVITHRKGTMEAANTVYGVTMEENGVSKLLSLKLT